MIQLSWMFDDYFPRSGSSKFSLQFPLILGSTNHDQNFFNFWISQIWYHSSGMNINSDDELHLIRSRLVPKIFEKKFLIQYFGLILSDQPLKKILSIFSEIFIFLNSVSSERGTSHSYVGPIYMALLDIFLEKWFFKVWTDIFLPQGHSPTTPKKFGTFDIFKLSVIR